MEPAARQPLQPDRGVGLQRDRLRDHRVGARQLPAGDVQHRDAECGVRHLRKLCEHGLKAIEALLPPRRDPETELVAPDARLEREGPPPGGDGLDRAVGADQKQRHRGMRLRQIAVQLDRPPRVRHGFGQRRRVRRVLRTRGLERPEVRVAEADVRQRVFGIEGERPFEVGNGRRDLSRVERLELQPAIGERAVRVEAGRLARRRGAKDLLERVVRRDIGDKPVAAPRHGLDVARRGRLIAERLAQLGHDLRQRVVGDRDVGPQRLEHVVLGHERRRAVEEEDQQIERLRRHRERRAVLQQAIPCPIDDEGSETIARAHDRAKISSRRGAI